MSKGNTRKNIFATCLEYFSQIISGLVLTPFLLAFMGTELFGIWRSLIRFTTFLLHLDGRPAQSLIWQIAHHHNTSHNKTSILRGAWGVWFIGAPVLLLCGMIAALFTPSLIHYEETNDQLVISIAILIVVHTLAMSAQEIPAGALQGAGKSYTKQYISTVYTLLLAGSFAVILAIEASLISLFYIQILCSLLLFFSTYLMASRNLYWFKWSRPTLQEVKNFLKHSRWYSGWALINKLLINGDLLLVAILLGAASATTYSLTGFASFTMLSIFSVVVANTITILGEEANKKSDTFYQQVNNLRTLTFCITALGTCALLIFNKMFISVWVGIDFYAGDNANLLLALIATQAIYFKQTAFLLDLSLKPEGKFKYGCLAVALSLVLSIAFQHTGIIGICLAVGMGRLLLNIVYPVLFSHAHPAVSSAPLKLQHFIAFTSCVFVSFLFGAKLEFESIFSGLATGALLMVLTTLAIYISLNASEKTFLKSLFYRKA